VSQTQLSRKVPVLKTVIRKKLSEPKRFKPKVYVPQEEENNESWIL